MLLESQDVELFFRLHRPLVFFVNQRLMVLPDEIASPDEFSSLSPDVRLKVRYAVHRLRLHVKPPPKAKLFAPTVQ
jgi:hypothetical protein